MQDKAWAYSFAVKKTDYQVLVDDPWFLEWTDTVMVTGGYLGYLGQLPVSTSSRSDFSLCYFGGGDIWNLGDRAVADWDSFLIDTIVTIDTEGILSKTFN